MNTPQNVLDMKVLKFVVKNWNTMTKPEILQQTGLSNNQLTNIVFKLRKAGFNMPKKTATGYINNLIQQLINEQGGTINK